jgi:hypothetical protein
MRSGAFLLCLLLASHAQSAMAYVDLGSSLLALQGLLAIGGALLIYVRHPLKAIERLPYRIRGKTPLLIRPSEV